MEKIQPGIRTQQQTIYTTASEIATAVPVFIGYVDKQSKAAEQPHKIDALADYENIFLKTDEVSPTKRDGYLYAVLKHYFEVGGESCFVLPLVAPPNLRANDRGSISAALAQAAQSEALAKEPTITLMAIPDLALLEPEPELEPESKLEANPNIEPKPEPAPNRQIMPNQWLEVWQAMLNTCKQNDWFALLDSPYQVEVAQQLIKMCADLEGSAEYGAAYWPRLQISASEHKYIPPSGSIAAMLQQIDRTRGVWKAPANVPLLHVIAPQYDHWQAQHLFNPDNHSINLIRAFAGRGVRVWGCRTLACAQHTQQHYVQTRRLLSYIKMHLKEIARFVTFEPNNPITWIKLKGLTRAWLRQLWLQGGLFGAVEEEAFRVFLGLDETMTQTDIQNGQLIMRVCVAPNYPAEFIDISLQFYTSENHSTHGLLLQNRKISA